MALVQKIDPVGLPLSVVLQKMVARRLYKAFKGIHFELEQGALKDIALAVDAHIAAGFGLVRRLVVLDAVGLNHGTGLAQDHVAFNEGFQVRAARHAVTLHKNGQL